MYKVVLTSQELGDAVIRYCSSFKNADTSKAYNLYFTKLDGDTVCVISEDSNAKV